MIKQVMGIRKVVIHKEDLAELISKKEEYVAKLVAEGIKSGFTRYDKFTERAAQSSRPDGKIADITGNNLGGELHDDTQNLKTKPVGRSKSFFGKLGVDVHDSKNLKPKNLIRVLSLRDAVGSFSRKTAKKQQMLTTHNKDLKIEEFTQYYSPHKKKLLHLVSGQVVSAIISEKLLDLVDATQDQKPDRINTEYPLLRDRIADILLARIKNPEEYSDKEEFLSALCQDITHTYDELLQYKQFRNYTREERIKFILDPYRKINENHESSHVRIGDEFQSSDELISQALNQMIEEWQGKENAYATIDELVTTYKKTNKKDLQESLMPINDVFKSVMEKHITGRIHRLSLPHGVRGEVIDMANIECNRSGDNRDVFGSHSVTRFISHISRVNVYIKEVQGSIRERYSKQKNKACTQEDFKQKVMNILKDRLLSEYDRYYEELQKNNNDVDQDYIRYQEEKKLYTEIVNHLCCYAFAELSLEKLPQNRYQGNHIGKYQLNKNSWKIYSQIKKDSPMVLNAVRCFINVICRNVDINLDGNEEKDIVKKLYRVICSMYLTKDVKDLVRDVVCNQCELDGIDNTDMEDLMCLIIAGLTPEPRGKVRIYRIKTGSLTQFAGGKILVDGKDSLETAIETSNQSYIISSQSLVGKDCYNEGLAKAQRPLVIIGKLPEILDFLFYKSKKKICCKTDKRQDDTFIQEEMELSGIYMEIMVYDPTQYTKTARVLSPIKSITTAFVKQTFCNVGVQVSNNVMSSLHSSNIFQLAGNGSRRLPLMYYFLLSNGLVGAKIRNTKLIKKLSKKIGLSGANLEEDQPEYQIIFDLGATADKVRLNESHSTEVTFGEIRKKLIKRIQEQYKEQDLVEVSSENEDQSLSAGESELLTREGVPVYNGEDRQLVQLLEILGLEEFINNLGDHDVDEHYEKAQNMAQPDTKMHELAYSQVLDPQTLHDKTASLSRC